MRVRQREFPILLIAIWTRSCRFSHQDRMQVVAKVGSICHPGGICPSADDNVQSSRLDEIRPLLEFRDDVFATLCKIAAAILPHVHDDTLYLVMIDEVKKLARKGDEVLSSGVSLEVEIESLLRREIGKPERIFFALPVKRQVTRRVDPCNMLARFGHVQRQTKQLARIVLE